MANSSIPYNRPPIKGREAQYLLEVLEGRHFSGDGSFTKRCHQWLKEELKTPKALLTHSCTAAMEMSAILANLQPGDEVIMPSYTFVSTANAVVLRGATPVFVDIRPDTLNLNEKLVEAAITPRTRAIYVVHYAGVGCDMDAFVDIAERRQLYLLEDAAQAMLATYKGRYLGTIGHLGSLSFHETKNIVSGEGGALLINDEKLADRAEIIREKGTNRSQFFRGQVDKYTWVDVGSSYLPSEFNAAVLLAQLETAKDITAERRKTWQLYYEGFADLEAKGFVRRPMTPAECEHNGHIFYLLARDLDDRTSLIQHLKSAGIMSPFHYVPLHSAPAGRKFGRTHGPMTETDSASDRLLRMPLYVGLSEAEVNRVIEAVHDFYRLRK
jgi:dTDP-4-amino-4,6-dideoxygalactose transaminase